MTKIIVTDGEHLTIEDVVATARARPGELAFRLADEARQRMARSRQAVLDFVARGEVVYGITTGFGAFKDRVIPLDQVAQLQQNILRSHSVGVGRPLRTDVVRAMMLIRANTLAKGYSGIRPEVVDLLLAMLERGVHPVVPEQGSLGASGDLAPLAHMSLVLIGEGEAEFEGERLPGAVALQRAGLKPITLEAKEGLALTNGTALMTALGALAVVEAENAAHVADIAGALSLEALNGIAAAFDDRLMKVRPHPRAIECAAYLRRLLVGSEFTRPLHSTDPQDAYTLRCIPQVHGACRDAILYTRWVVDIELNSATDNPLIFVDNETGQAEAISGGNFHGEPLAIAFDYLGLALTELGNMAERRLTRLTDASSNRHVLPDFLTEHGGLNSGFMMVQYTAAALASENKALVHPASADTIPTSANWEDHNSNGPIAARQARQILRNLERILAIELFAAAQGIDFRRRGWGNTAPLGSDARLGQGTAAAYTLIRQHVPFIGQDTVMSSHIETVRELVTSGRLVSAVEAALGATTNITN
ncbi:MAG TPA: histidine ammonia-lyase [Anaerolineae bacterium]|nr:histidine ammonia-lyase [Anaerolineae bacterium]HIQ05058.1 histidine ammonia-lyase [Anaerolineae bacterium]